jgi:transposase
VEVISSPVGLVPRNALVRTAQQKVATGAGCRINKHMRHTARDLSDNQWKVLNRLIPKPTRRSDGRGRSVLNGILWVLRTGAPWADLPEAYPSFQTCHRRFQQWVRSGVMRGILEALALDLKHRGAIDVREAFIDASFAPAKKGA